MTKNVTRYALWISLELIFCTQKRKDKAGFCLSPQFLPFYFRTLILLRDFCLFKLLLRLLNDILCVGFQPCCCSDRLLWSFRNLFSSHNVPIYERNRIVDRNPKYFRNPSTFFLLYAFNLQCNYFPIIRCYFLWVSCLFFLRFQIVCSTFFSRKTEIFSKEKAESS